MARSRAHFNRQCLGSNRPQRGLSPDVTPMPELTSNVPGARLSRRDRAAAGKALRDKVSRESHADFAPAEGRDPAAILAEVDATRIQALIPLRYERMLQSPFTFFRGSAAVMAADLAGTKQVGIPVQACGDCHLMNFGAFPTPESRVLFDINDFDETLPGVDFTADVKRLASSVAVAALDAGHSEKKARSFAGMAAKGYREFIRELAKESPLAVWHTRMDLAREIERIDDAKLRDRILATIVKAKKDLALDDNFPHLAKTEGDDCRIEDRPPLIYHLDQGQQSLRIVDTRSVLANYQASLPPERAVLLERFSLHDVAFKVVGVGSVGTFCAIGLYMTADGEPLFLQIKEAQVSAMEKLRLNGPRVTQQGHRVAAGQRVMQAATDIFLAPVEDRKTGRHFYVRQLKNRRLGSVGEVMEEEALTHYAALCGRTLARAHARSSDPAMLGGYMGKGSAFEDAMASFAITYARQTTLDHAEVKRVRAEQKPSPKAPTSSSSTAPVRRQARPARKVRRAR
jgi:uncharacterized protein (DUF2252 family)